MYMYVVLCIFSIYYTITYHCACRFKKISVKSPFLYITQYSSHVLMTLFMWQVCRDNRFNVDVAVTWKIWNFYRI